MVDSYFRRLLGKDLNGMGLNELRLLEHQLNEGLLAIKERKEELLIQQLEYSRKQVNYIIQLKCIMYIY